MRAPRYCASENDLLNWFREAGHCQSQEEASVLLRELIDGKYLQGGIPSIPKMYRLSDSVLALRFMRNDSANRLVNASSSNPTLPDCGLSSSETTSGGPALAESFEFKSNSARGFDLGINSDRQVHGLDSRSDSSFRHHFTSKSEAEYCSYQTKSKDHLDGETSVKQDRTGSTVNERLEKERIIRRQPQSSVLNKLISGSHVDLVHDLRKRRTTGENTKANRSGKSVREHLESLQTQQLRNNSAENSRKSLVGFKKQAVLLLYDPGTEDVIDIRSVPLEINKETKKYKQETDVVSLHSEFFDDLYDLEKMTLRI